MVTSLKYTAECKKLLLLLLLGVLIGQWLKKIGAHLSFKMFWFSQVWVLCLKCRVLSGVGRSLNIGKGIHSCVDMCACCRSW